MKHDYRYRIAGVLFIVLFTAVSMLQAADKTTTAQGGKWSETTSWVGGVVPTLSDNVIITSTVTANGGSYSTTSYPMANLTVNSGGKIIREKNSGGLSYLKISGNLTNNGEIIDQNDYFDIDLSGNLINNGVLKPRYINLIGVNQQLSGTKAIECKQINLNMSDEFAVAASNLMFKNCRINSGVSITNKKLKMGKYSLSLLADSIRYDSYYGSVSSSSEIVIPIVFEGTGILNVENSLAGGTIYGNVLVKSPSYAFFKDLTIEGNLTLDEGGKFSSQGNVQKLRVKGDFTNYADLNKDTVKVRKVKFAPRSMYLFVYGNSNNLGSTGITTVYPVTNGKTISLKGNYAGNVYVQQSEASDKPGGKVVISTEAGISGKLDVYAGLEIGAGGTLSLLNRKSTAIYVRPDVGSLTNKGKMYQYHLVNNSSTYRSFSKQAGMNVDYELRTWTGRIEGMDVTVQNGQTYPGLPGSTKTWWHIAPSGEGKVTGYTLKLYYDEAMLNGQKEKNLKAFRSGDKGKTWELISVGSYAVLDTLENSITIGTWSNAASMLKEFGDFVISSGDGSVPMPSPILVNLIGSPNVRLGAPTRYTVHLYNAGNSRSESFVAAITVTDDIVFKQVELPAKEGKIILPVDSLGTKKDHTQLFFIPYLDPNEAYSLDVVVVGVNPGTKSAGLGVPTLTATGLGKAGAKEKIEDYLAEELSELAELNDEEALEYGRAMGLTVQQLNMKKEKEGVGAFSIRTTIKYAVEQASKTNPISKIAFKVGSAVEFVSKIKDSYRRRIWHWLYKETGLYGVDEIEVVSGKNMEGKMVTSWDPNEKLGPTGFGQSNHMAKTGPMNYTILFENKKEATAAAYRIQVVDTLAAVFDPATVKFGTTSHSGPNYNWKMERNGNILKWDIEGIELPPNRTPPEGEGFVTFTVGLKKNLLSGTEIKNRATIVFDINPPIATNTWKNVLDTIPPQTVMNPIKYANGDSVVSVSCTATDNVNGSGTGKYTFFASVNNEPFRSIGESFQNAVLYPVTQKTKNTYRFYALATDQVNNAEQSVHQIIELKSIPLSGELNEPFTGTILLYPNPTSGIVTAGFTVADRAEVELNLYSVTGELIKTTGSVWYEPGRHQIDTDLSNVQKGIYFAQIKVSKKIETFKVIKN